MISTDDDSRSKFEVMTSPLADKGVGLFLIIITIVDQSSGRYESFNVVFQQLDEEALPGR